MKGIVSNVVNIHVPKIYFGTRKENESTEEEFRRICLQVAALSGIWKAKAELHEGALVYLKDVVDELDRVMELEDLQ